MCFARFRICFDASSRKPGLEAVIQEASFWIGLQSFRSPVELAPELDCMSGVMSGAVAKLSE
eukprot:10465879-Prorocentrum_lima.AAC.1